MAAAGPREVRRMTHPVKTACRGAAGVLLLGLAALQAGAQPVARDVVLTARITVENRGGVAIAPYIHRVTIPASDSMQQTLLGYDYPYPDRPEVKTHRDGDGRYLELSLRVPPHSTLEREVRFRLRVTPFDYRAMRRAEETPFRGPPKPEPTAAPQYLEPSLYVESDNPAFERIAGAIERTYLGTEQRARAAYLYPQWTLDYRRQRNRGALYALQHGTGDCTEYAALFVAISRAMEIPARMTAAFLFSGDQRRFDVPNHQAAEVFLDGRWLPVDPNLALEPELGYGFGEGGTTKVVLKRGDDWVWSNWTPGSAPAPDRWDVDMEWTLEAAPADR